MISIIICSRRTFVPITLIENIKNSIGCDYELIVIDNSRNRYSIFEAYNIGIEKSKSDYLCFLHDDILIHTIGWGEKLKSNFRDNRKIGLIGIAGAKCKSKMPSAWWDCPKQMRVVNIIQHFPNKTKENRNYGFKSELLSEVVVIDGVFMSLRKVKGMQFNTKFKGFHNYDLNISFEVIKRGYQIMVTSELLIEHFSLGTIDKKWLISTNEIHKEYEAVLPFTLKENFEIKKYEISNAKTFINQSLLFKQNKLAFLVWLKLFFVSPFMKYHMKFWFNFLRNLF